MSGILPFCCSDFREKNNIAFLEISAYVTTRNFIELSYNIQEGLRRGSAHARNGRRCRHIEAVDATVVLPSRALKKIAIR